MENELINVIVDFDGISSVDSLQLKLSGIKIENLDTVAEPLRLLQPIDAHVLKNSLIMGSSDHPLRTAIDMNSGFDSNYFFMDDSLELIISVSNAEALISIMAMMNSKAFLEFPMSDILNIDCWRVTISSPTLDDEGFRIEGDPTLALEHVLISFTTFALDVSCISCESIGMQEVPVVIDLINDALANATLGLLEHFISLLNGDFSQVAIDRYLNSTASACPHHPEYSVIVPDSSYESLSVPLLTEDTWEDIAFMAVAMAEVVLVVFAINIEGYDRVEPNPLSAQNDFIYSEETNLLNLSTDSTISY